MKIIQPESSKPPNFLSAYFVLQKYDFFVCDIIDSKTTKNMTYLLWNMMRRVMRIWIIYININNYVNIFHLFIILLCFVIVWNDYSDRVCANKVRGEFAFHSMYLLSFEDSVAKWISN